MYNTNDIVLSPLTLAMPGWGYLFGIIYTKCIHTNCHRGVNFGLKNAEIDFFWPKNAGNYAKKRNLPQNANYLPWESVKNAEKYAGSKKRKSRKRDYGKNAKRGIPQKRIKFGNSRKNAKKRILNNFGNSKNAKYAISFGKPKGVAAQKSINLDLKSVKIALVDLKMVIEKSCFVSVKQVCSCKKSLIINHDWGP